MTLKKLSAGASRPGTKYQTKEPPKMTTKNFQRDMRQPSAGTFSSLCSVENMAVEMSVAGQIMPPGRTRYRRVTPAMA